MRETASYAGSGEATPTKRQIRFGATVTVRTVAGPHAGQERRLQIVAVDEADAAAGRVTFIAPIARAVLGLGVGESALLRVPRGEEELEIVAIAYDPS